MLEQLVERGLVVTGVVDDADRGLVAVGERRDEVLAPQLQRVHPQLVGELVHHDLDQWVASGRPAPRIASVGNLFVFTLMTSVTTAGVL